MPKWDASHYLRYGTERTRAAADLLARIDLESPQNIVDLGCGPGNSTALLRHRWPDANLLGVDSSAEMIATAKKTFIDQQWLQCEVNLWKPQIPYDLVYANATLHWLPNHDELLGQLFNYVATGGALAFQIPSAIYPTVRKLVFEISRQSQWNDRMIEPRSRLTMESPDFYYDQLIQTSSNIDIWETEYMHELDSKQAIVDWISSTGLRPFMDALDTDEQTEFKMELRSQVNDAYDLRADGKVLFPFRRTFVIAYH